MPVKYSLTPISAYTAIISEPSLLNIATNSFENVNKIQYIIPASTKAVIYPIFFNCKQPSLSPLPKHLLISGWLPCAIPLNAAVVTIAILATTPYAATPIFPAIPSITKLYARVITADDISPTKADTPNWHPDTSSFTDGLHTLILIVLFLEKKCIQHIAIPITGERTVASAAPSIPSFIGNIRM